MRRKKLISLSLCLSMVVGSFFCVSCGTESKNSVANSQKKENVQAEQVKALEPAAKETPDDGLTEEEREQADEFAETQVKGVRVTKQIEKKVVVTWKKLSGATRYQVLRSTKKKSGYVSIGSTKKTSFKDKKAKKRTTYYYKVQGELSISDQKIQSKESAAKKVYVTPKSPVTVIAGECFVVDMSHMKSIFGKNHRFVGKIGVNTYTMIHNNYFNYNGNTIPGIERIAYYKPDRVYFIIGANEARWYNVNLTMDNYKKMRSLLKRVNKNVEIVLVKISPFGAKRSSDAPSDAQRAKFNRAYKNYADKTANVYYCKATDVLENSAGQLSSGYNGGDGYHWNDAGTVAVVKKMKEWSKKIFGTW